MQRINLTTALGTSLVNTLFVLDEPSIGLHPRDMGRVIDVMQKLRDAGNSLVVVEHDPQIMFAADRILDMGPGPGERGGEIVFSGTPDELKRATHADRRLPRRDASAPTAASRPCRPSRGGPEDRASRRRRAQPEGHRRRHPAQPARLRDRRVRLRQVDAGAGRAVRRAAESEGQADRDAGRASRAARRRARRRGRARRPVADRHARRARTRRATSARSTRSASSSPTRRSRRSARYTPGTFSFNAGNGRCPTCGGNGFEHVEMQFLSDVYLRCPDCDGKRFRPEVLEVQVQGPQHRRHARADGVRGARVLRRRGRRRAPCSRRSPTSASSTCGSASRCRRSPAAKRSGSSSPAISPSRAARARARRRARSSSSTSRPPACTSTTSRSCSGRSGS